ncbi:MAG: Asp-tRNA(Asn)/Glu-tRNA(Gln) amidotransferase subunit GatA [Acidobacteria bacterium]|nr:Asp-tRNA(Asn)/Glu-tRNA(Gln) amidotransferase subunit GatA [Acidobacteriota bacterium]
MDLAFQTIEQLAPLLKKKKVSPVELLDAVLARIEALNPKLNAYITVCAAAAREQAKRAEREIARGRYRGPLHGIPISLKDNIATKGIRTTAGSKILADNTPREDATVAKRLRRAGAVLVGKTNLHEFAYGVTTENPHYGSTRNPWDTSRIPGGSSGGSAAALAAGMCYASVGTDTGGSIRIPAALCGLVGFKPTYGRVSACGTIPLSPTLDHVGPLARTVTDAAIVLRTITGRDPCDTTTLALPPLTLPENLGKLPKRLRLGLPRDYFFDGLDEEVRRAILKAAKHFEQWGAEIIEVSLPSLADSVETSNHIALAEATHYHQRQGWWPPRAADYGEDVRKRLKMGADVRAVDYIRAFEMQRRIRAEFECAFALVDALLVPVTPVPAPQISQKMLSLGGEEETVRAALLRLCRPANLAGLPAVSVPCGFTSPGLPLGLQLIGPACGEEIVLRLALAYEQAHGWRKQHPVL